MRDQIVTFISTKNVYLAYNLSMLLNYVTINRLNAFFLFILCNLTINTHFLPLRPFSGEQQVSRGAMFIHDHKSMVHGNK